MKDTPSNKTKITIKTISVIGAISIAIITGVFQIIQGNQNDTFRLKGVVYGIDGSLLRENKLSVQLVEFNRTEYIDSEGFFTFETRKKKGIEQLTLIVRKVGKELYRKTVVIDNWDDELSIEIRIPSEEKAVGSQKTNIAMPKVEVSKNTPIAKTTSSEALEKPELFKILVHVPEDFRHSPEVFCNAKRIFFEREEQDQLLFFVIKNVTPGAELVFKKNKFDSLSITLPEKLVNNLRINHHLERI